ncbi:MULTISPECIES: taurine ABC transporter substrate-binding protein [Ensifer]|uniref:taurine ABC transporter substrate-binding protein n=1 Tax=Ensifer TaxID=106591 RepID=UPI00070A7D77|nr:MULTISPECIES: taurine ABC transporter substrate-binding protein [Ensifer]KQW62055.1 taurine ABC transporter substrate-binding protein [Ensifer sp. Root1252]KQW82162.1 taurine ABC transporter substrate-binding protein [Ensifer sp. Root127]KRC83208.1 taurine ABC transporter substrate-binding protein [Ensifer sp. Root231]KRC85081.1 taurine ABC transporter substrate-binding protein [Ensifer sp. Root258]NOV17450.1 taurine ABC transporter substrate-binding protein [Ensifer canadensis]
MFYSNALKTMAGAATIAAGLLTSSLARAETNVIIGYQQIVGPFIAAIADGRFDAAAKEAGYLVDWRQFSSGGDISTALASGNVPIGVIGSTGTTAAATRGVDLELFWILDNIGKSEALVAREGSGIEKPEDLVGRSVGVPFVSTSHFHLLVGLEQVWKVDPREVNILNMKPPQIVAAWQRGDIDAAYVWPPALSELLKTGKVISDSEAIGAASVPTFDGLVVDKKWAAENPKFMAAFTKVLAEAYADYKANGASWTADSAPVQNIVKLIGGDGAGTVEALNLLSFPTAQEQASETWLGGGAVRALSESAKFLADQKQIDKALDDYAPYVNSAYAKEASK